MEGFIKIFRTLLDWEWYSDGNTMRVFLHCLLSANYQDKKWQGITIERGQLVTSVNKLSEQLNLSTQQVRTAINKLESTQNITIKSTNKYTIITICNYDNYQDANISEQQTKQQTNNKQTTNKQQTNNNNIRIEEYKEIKNNIPKSNTNVLPKGFNIKEYLLSKNVAEDIADAWLIVRKNKKAPATELAMKLIDKEVVKAGMTWQEAISECVLRNWQGFKAEWLHKEEQSVRGRGNAQWTEEEHRQMREFCEQFGI